MIAILRKQQDSPRYQTAAFRRIRKLARNVSALPEARFQDRPKCGEELCARSVKPLKVTARFAADAGVMQIQLSEAWVWHRS